MPKRTRLKRVNNSSKKRIRLDRLSDDEVNDLFSNVIMEKMGDDQFWDWVRGWKDPESLVNQALDWDVDTKRDDLKQFAKKGLI